MNEAAYEQAIDLLIARQREYFLSGATLPVAARVDALRKLYAAVEANRDEIAAALHKDLGKSEYESFMCEIGLTLTEIRWMIRNTPRLARRRRAATPLAQFAASSWRLRSPRGCTLIMSPWNYPFLLTIEPLADAIAAGNTAIIKPSAYSPATSEVISRLIRLPAAGTGRRRHRRAQGERIPADPQV